MPAIQLRALSPSVGALPWFHAGAEIKTTDIGEYEPQYASVINGTAIPTWPVSSPSRWNVLVEALLVGSTVVTPNTTVVGAPSNRAVALLDSGTSYSSVVRFSRIRPPLILV